MSERRVISCFSFVTFVIDDSLSVSEPREPGNPREPYNFWLLVFFFFTLFTIVRYGVGLYSHYRDFKNYRNSMYIELPSHSLLQGGPYFFADFCDRVKKKKLLTKNV